MPVTVVGDDERRGAGRAERCRSRTTSRARRARATAAAASARAHAEAVAVTVATYRRLLQEAAGSVQPTCAAAGDDVGERLGARWPDLFEELEGIAAGARPGRRASCWRSTPAPSCSAGAGECSLHRAARAGGAWLAQTWDWHPDLARRDVAWTVAARRTAGSRR